MANVKEYWDAVNAEASHLPPFCWLMSLDTREGGKGGVMVHVTGVNAAKALVARTHRIATPEEVARHEGVAQETRDEVNALFERQRLLLQPLVQAMKPQPQPQPPAKGKGEK